jgi:hypothetical protein
MLKKVQLKDELEGGTPDDHALFGESPLEPFLKIREQIIRKHTQDLHEVKILELAKATRGMNEQDIVSAIWEYRTSGKLPSRAQGTNTCNPLNGSWTERILPFKAYTSLYNSAGFKVEFHNGFYNIYEAGVRNFVKKMLNAGIRILGNKISPYIVIVGSKNK